MIMEKIFKAKRLDNGEWHVFNMSEMASTMLVDPSRAFISAEGVTVLDKNTICQYTGIDAKNGRIFEGDRVYITGVGKVIAATTPNGVTFGGWDYQDVIEDIEKLTGHNIHDDKV